MDKEQKKWSTFLQKPDRPIPQKKQLFGVGVIGQGYKVQIVKQPKPRVAPDRTPTPEPQPEIEPEEIPIQSVEIEPEKEPTLDELLDSVVGGEKDEGVEDGCGEIQLTDNDLPDLEQMDGDDEQLLSENHEEKIDENHCNDEDDVIVEEELEIIPKTKEELFLEQQLENVQKQLMALSNLPFTIQATLDAVTQQLNQLVPAIKNQTQQKRIKSEPIATQDDTDETTLQENKPNDDNANVEEIIENGLDEENCGDGADTDQAITDEQVKQTENGELNEEAINEVAKTETQLKQQPIEVQSETVKKPAPVDNSSEWEYKRHQVRI